MPGDGNLDGACSSPEVQSKSNNVYGQTPNFAMDSDDINIELDASETRFTAHLFDRSYTYLLPTGPVVRVPNDLADWPPAGLFDAVYAVQ